VKRDFIRLSDCTEGEIESLLKRSIDLKAGADRSKCPLIGKSVGLLFEKPSTRTRVSFEVAIYQLGGQALYLSPKEIQIGRGETVSDTARVLSRYLSAIVLRTNSHRTVEEFASSASVPVINGLSDLHHPCQALADLMTILEAKGRMKGVRLGFVGDGNNVANSLIEAAARAGIDLTLACPEGFEPSSEVLAAARHEARGTIRVVRDPVEAARDADALYTDVWVSMGQEGEADRRKATFRPFQVNNVLLRHAKSDVIVLHCLPAHRGEEITDEVIDGSRSVVFDQAENRLHTEKAILEFLVT
jgi:ornithine carbamoyltransferase